ncbi:DUF262 domain-containing protein [Verrucosispora sp. WMMD1129]|uniref:DUF262 domain-containing protein n=1 Tax=Verrucosispora sp. WMMD1129 TaxID=3016093 RepID=UPI00249C0CA6|nr:DUF262 domain-containing protein [Verrucosispora sp. WMMD1129]WFE43502.1 DUF262 domain-containing protein [Verrucosispora sp. WMMD1129]
MGFQPAITIADAITKIQRRELVLPAIQRAFVWNDDQITRLFDSILRGYPIGSFLSWHVRSETSGQFKFYEFMREYHEKDNRYSKELDVPHGQAVVAVLDGQQRLTSLNVALRGYHASRIRYGHKNQPKSYPPRRLYLNVLGEAPENDRGVRHDFRLLAEPVTQPTDGTAYWFPVYELFATSDLGELMAMLAGHGLGNNPYATKLIGTLFNLLHSKPILHFYEEADQDIDKVLDIFIRVNSAGTVLSQSDLLLSIATAQWGKRDARKEIQALVDALNGPDQRFWFSKDVVLKSGLMLTGVADVGFKVRNFNRNNMLRLEERWDEVTNALTVAAGLLGDFGLSSATLTANSVLIPVAYYVHRRGLDEHYRDRPADREDRAAVRSWVIRSLLKQGVWGSGLDTLLRELREVIDKHGAESFPVEQIEERMRARGKTLTFAPAEVEDLMEGWTYGSAGVFSVLALLFPHVNTRNLHHIDHVFPRSLLTRARLKKYGKYSEDQLDLALWYRDSLANLQLLEGPENIAKKDKLPRAWAEATFSAAGYQNYLELNALPDLPISLDDYLDWCERRYHLLGRRLALLLGTTWEAEAPTNES